ncbi:hypothetical protein BH11MYX4_BH11MYX4_42250 [soil metagenome]
MRFNRPITLFSAVLLGACAVAAPDDEDSTRGIASALDRDRDQDRDRDRRDDRRCDDSRVVFTTAIATGIPGAGAVCQVGNFLRSSPLHDRAAFLPFTAPGGVANNARLFVASSSNFGAPLGQPGQYPGTVLSIDPSATSAVPSTFAAAGDQATTEGGRVIVYASNSPAFANSRFEPQAVTATEMAASLPLGISLNNGNGRPWVANAPTGTSGDGTITVIDPQGFPLAGAPSPTAGGVFKGTLTNRSPASTHGITAGAPGTAILTKSPDNSGRAVFVAAQADGAIVQIHVQKGVDGLVPAGTLAPLSALTPANAESIDRRVVTRNGMAFNWAPKRVLYVTDAKTDRVLAFDLADDGTLFTAAAPRALRADRDHGHGHHHWLDRDDDDGDDDVFNIPIDVQAVIPETASENFASNSTLAVGSDLYVLNRGNNTVVRVTQDGTLVAKRKIIVQGHPLFRANGMGVSPDGKTIWVTGQTAFGGGIVTKIAGFGSGPIMPGLMTQAAAAGATSTTALGGFFFNKSYSRSEGVGPLFNAQSCATCHSDPIPGGMSSTIFDTFITSARGPVARFHSITELGGRCNLPVGLGSDAAGSSRRSSMTLRNSSLIDFVSPTDIRNGAAAQPAAIRGRANILADGRVGKFGWKAAVPSLVEFMGLAYRNEQGLTNGLVREDQQSGCGANDIRPELDALPLVTTSHFMTTLDAPAPTAACTSSAGAAVFQAAGCAGCHTPSFAGPGFRANLYSDLLLHDMGPALADGFVQGSATGSEFRTMTLTRLAERSHFLHDGRALDLSSAITAHGGQGAAASTAFSSLRTADRDALLAFLGCL